MLCFFEPNLTASLSRDEALCINNYKCLTRTQIEDPNKLDKICRSLDSPFCYCCGGTKNYVEHGKICRRFCAIEIIKGKATRPCQVNEQYNLEVNEAPISVRDPYPARITLVPMSELICRGQSRNPESSSSSTTSTTESMTSYTQSTTSYSESTTSITESTTSYTESTTSSRPNDDYEEELITPINDDFRFGIDIPFQSKTSQKTEDDYDEDLGVPINDQFQLGGYGIDLRQFQ